MERFGIFLMPAMREKREMTARDTGAEEVLPLIDIFALGREVAEETEVVMPSASVKPAPFELPPSIVNMPVMWAGEKAETDAILAIWAKKVKFVASRVLRLL